MASFYDVIGVDPPAAFAPPPPESEPRQVESKGWGQTFSEGFTNAWENLGVGVSAARGASEATLASDLKDTRQFKPSFEEEDYRARVKDRTDAFTKEPSFSGALDVVTEVFSNLKVAGGDAVKSLVSSSPQIAAGVAGLAVGGPIGGVIAYFGAGLPVAMLNDSAGELQERLAKRGVDTSDEAATTRALKENPDLVEESLRAGANGGRATWAVESTLELATGLIGGKLLKPLKDAAGKPLLDAAGKAVEVSLGKTAAVGAGATVVGATGEGLGAAAADLAKGKELKSGEYLAEGALALISEGPTAIIDVAAGRAVMKPEAVITEIFDKNKTVEEAASAAAGIIDRIIADTPTNRRLQQTQLDVQSQVDAAMKEVATSTVLEGAIDNAATRSPSPGPDVGQAPHAAVPEPPAGLRDPSLDLQSARPGPGPDDGLDLGGADSGLQLGLGGAARPDAAAGVQPAARADAIAPPVASDPGQTAQSVPAAPATPASAVPALPDAVAVKTLNMGLEQLAAARGAAAEAVTLVDVASLPVARTVLPDERQTLSQSDAVMVQDYAATFGKKVVFVRGISGDGSMMNSLPNTVFLNADAKAAHHLVVTAHEVTHHMEREQPALFNQLVAALPKSLTDANLTVFATTIKRSPEQVAEMLADPVKRNDLVGEFVADLMGNTAADLRSHLQILAKGKDPGLIMKIGRFIVQFIDRLLEGQRFKRFSETQSLVADDLQKTRRVFRQVMAEYAVAQNPGQAKLAAKVAEVQAAKAAKAPAPNNAPPITGIAETAEPHKPAGEPPQEPRESAERLPYDGAPANLMGFGKDRRGGPGKSFGEQRYSHTEYVEVALPGGEVIVDAIKGLNKPHALARARRNWPDSQIRAISADEAESRDRDVRESAERAEPRLGRAGAFLLPAEKANLRSDTAKRVVELFTNLPSAREMAAVAFAGRAKRGWYKDSAEALVTVFGADAPRFAALLASLSPQTSVEVNLENALNTWKNWVAENRPRGRREILAVMGRSVQGGRKKSVMAAWRNNAFRSLTAADPAALTISGPKVNSFFRNLVGVTDEVTNDSWMAGFSLVNQKIFGGALNVAGKRNPESPDARPGKGSGYLAMSARVRQAADVLTKLTGQTWTPSEVQETIWAWTKTLYELQVAAGETRGARELLRDQALTNELLRSTPDFRTLLNAPANAATLRGAGLKAGLARLDRANAARPGSQEPGARGEAAPFDRGTSERLLNQAGHRLEKLRERRLEEGEEPRMSAERSAAPVISVDERLNTVEADARLAPLSVTVKAIVAETGREVTFEQPAAAAIADVRARLTLARQLQTCLNS